MHTTHRAAALAAVAVLLAGAGTAQAAGTGHGQPVRAADAAAGPAITVDTTTGRHAIDPHIYGMNFPDQALAKDLRLPLGRWGGNATTRYNYTNDAYNAGSDWYFEDLHYNNDTSALPDGSQADKFVEQNRAAGSDTLMTVPMIGWTAAGRDDGCGFSIAEYGPQQGSDAQWRPDCGNGTRTDGTLITGNDPAETSTPAGPDFVKGWVQYLDRTYGNADSGGVRFYDLDNEPDLWQSTHRDVHPAGADYDELRDSTYTTAAAVKDADPAAQTLGPVGWGFNSLIYSGRDQQVCSEQGGSCWSNPPDRAAHGGVEFAPWYLQQMKAYDQEHGRRILDYFDEHIYPQQSGVSGSADDAATQALRLRSTRQLWDPSYVDESWINQPIQFIPRMRSLVDQNYPGTKLAISEYNWGALDHVDGGLAEADVLGIFGREGLDLATLWSPPAATDPGAFAFRMYLNYDGNGGTFGDTAVHAASADQDKLSVYAAERSTDHATTVMVVNKTTDDLAAPVSLTAGSEIPAAAQVYRYGQADPTAIEHAADQPLGGGSFTGTFPAYSITEYVIPAGSTQVTPPSAPGTPAASAIGPDRVTLTWPAATPGTSPLAGYRVYAGDPATTAPLATVTSPATTATVTGLSPATAYTFRVVATDTAGRSSPPSAPLQVTTGQAPADGCTAAYQVSSDWGSGFTANVTVTNHAAQVNGWHLGFTFTGNQKVVQGWNGTWSQTGTAVTVTDAGWNAALPTGASTTIGFNGSYTGTNATPGAFTLNGTPCATAPPTLTPATGHAPPPDAAR
ncbi:glycoside hydrolase family 44 protein [Actinacidiphila bryophytorum]|uniref:Endoglucanase n=1 Tax=Actinacidiphila bryophytorum TaxID=1436133 RepID=A0A9W4H2Z2_9ACTN|nr:glycoside hydrolase family 44 protein [Actinacidiphila bryophytorum]MBM9437091.1 cellulose binding domain-containing protein [Actinacidiphila bryophytorum]MBN6542026.1 cellulose binding domain-containing protein [Actinacidiphila bryophytorum]CAG7646596.1 Endoglucanase [Actinacidiphila bryophytorum]